MEKKIILIMLIGIAFLTKGLYAQQFTEQTAITLIGVSESSVAWGDFDNDGNLDILLSGSSSSGAITKIYKNNGDNTFTEQTSISLSGVDRSSLAWGDYDNDGDLDILLSGYSVYGAETKIYKNNGNSSFTEQSNIPLMDVYGGIARWGDSDNDGDLDIFLSGIGGYDAGSKIYRNEGNNSFKELTESVLNVTINKGDLGDYDNDGDLDILAGGAIFQNYGNNIFIGQAIYLSGSDVWGDYDNDGDLDIIGGSKIYRNEGNNSFAEQTNISFNGLSIEFAVWGDYDNDGYLDILLVGDPGDYTSITKIYKNNGDNSFTEQADISLAGVSQGSIAWGDYDNDGDLDILLAGSTGSENITKIYMNNNAVANVKPNTITNLQETINGNDVTFSWDVATDPNQSGGLNYNLYVFDLDENAYSTNVSAFRQNHAQNGKRLVTQKGEIQINNHVLSLRPGNYVWSVQAVDGTFSGGNFAAEKTFTIQGVDILPRATQYLNPDQEGNVLTIYETSASSQREWKFSTSPGGPYQSFSPAQTGAQFTPSFHELNSYYVVCQSVINTITYTSNEVEIIIPWFMEQSILLTGVTDASLAWGDYDNDGDLDILLVGDPGEYTGITKIYKNNGDNSFTEQTNISITGVYDGSAKWGDYDNDGDLDILLSGNIGSYVGITKIYRNNGSNSFTEQTDISIVGLYNSSVDWGDYDNDGDLDILITGEMEYNVFLSKIYKNNGNNSFAELTNMALPGATGSGTWSDYDNDGDLDILLTGYIGPGYISKIYKNNGSDSFSEQTSITLTGVSGCTIAWGDYDNDGDLDILLNGYSPAGVTKIYKNNGDNSFTEQTNISLPAIWASNVAWGDYNNDGLLDILLSGESMNGLITKIYKNNGDNSFTEQTSIDLPGLYDSRVAWGDYDNDSDLDILITFG